MSDVEWKEPPADQMRAQRVLAELQSRPGEWALIAHTPGMEFLPWWGEVVNHPKVEAKYVKKTDRLLGPSDVYARFTS